MILEIWFILIIDYIEDFIEIHIMLRLMFI